MEKTSILIRLNKELKEKLEIKATEQRRSITAHIIHLIEQDLDKTKVPIIGKVTADGRIEFDPDYWETDEGIEQSR